MPEIKPLTGIRGVAALWVAYYHEIQSLQYGNKYVQTLGTRGYIAVDLFFILSGFVMTVNYGNKFRRKWLWSDWFIFMFKRLARIYPLYFFAHVLLLVVNYTGLRVKYVDYKVSKIIPCFMVINSWGITWAMLGPAWSVSAEMFSYCVFPLLTRALVHTRARYGALWAIATACAVTGVYLLNLNGDYGGRHSGGTFDVWRVDTLVPLSKCVSEFGLGIVACRLAQHERTARVLNKMRLVMLSTVLYLCLLPIKGTDMALVACSFFLVLGFGAEVFEDAAKRSYVSQFLSHPILMELGNISYSVYLISDITFGCIFDRKFNIEGTSYNTSHLVKATFTTAVNVLVALFTYRYVEKTGRRIILQYISSEQLRERAALHECTTQSEQISFQTGRDEKDSHHISKHRHTSSQNNSIPSLADIAV